MKNLSTIPLAKRMFIAVLLFAMGSTLMTSKSFAQSDVLFRDDFNGSMESGWTWVRENPATWSLTATGLRIEIENGSLNVGGVYSKNYKNILLRSAPANGDYTIEAKVNVELLEPYAKAGMVLYQDDDNYATFGLHRAGFAPYTILIRVASEHTVNGDYIFGSAEDLVNTSRTAVYLKLEKSGESFNFYYSRDGNNWIYHSKICILNFTPRIGLVAFDESEDQTSGLIEVAEYDYFEIKKKLTPPYEICAGESVQIGCPVSYTSKGCRNWAPMTYEWSPATGLNNPTSGAPIASPDVTTTYTLRVTGYGGCIATGQFTVKVKLCVPHYSQGIGDWKEKPYDHLDPVTIQSKGCALTSVVMYLRSHRIKSGPTGEDVNPLTLNNFLKTSNGYLANGSVIWGSVIDYAKKSGFPGFSFESKNGSNDEILDNELSKNNPVIHSQG